MKKIIILLLFLIFNVVTISSADELKIEIGMKFSDAKRMLATIESTETILSFVYIGEESSEALTELVFYNIPENRTIIIEYNKETEEIVSLEFIDALEMAKYRLSKGRYFDIEKIDLLENTLKKYISIADSEAQKLIEEFNKSDLSKTLEFNIFITDYYSVAIKESLDENRELLEISYKSWQNNIRGFPQHFSIWVYKDTLETKIFKGR